MNAGKCLFFYKHKNQQMHTTNKVPQSRCRAFFNLWRTERNGQMELEEVEACWGTPLFFFLTSQTRLWVCATNTQPTHTHTALEDTSACTHHPHRRHAPAATVVATCGHAQVFQRSPTIIPPKHKMQANPQSLTRPSWEYRIMNFLLRADFVLADHM